MNCEARPYEQQLKKKALCGSSIVHDNDNFFGFSLYAPNLHCIPLLQRKKTKLLLSNRQHTFLSFTMVNENWIGSMEHNQTEVSPNKI